MSTLTQLFDRTSELTTLKLYYTIERRGCDHHSRASRSHSDE
ncbi:MULTISPECIES: hypothetical protein [unclassified Microcoleus]|nr:MULTISPECIES: hypothetical protein [unclassified Microcoleus]